MRLIWLRHGETAANLEKRYCGHLDLPLHEQGFQQADTVAEQLAFLPLTMVFSSDLLRCRQTAERVCVHHPGVSFHTTSLLRELSFGEWEGLTYEEIRSRDPNRLHRWIRDPVGVAPPGGEGLNQMGERLKKWMKTSLKDWAGDEVYLIVCHGGPIRWFFSDQVRRDPSSFWDLSIPPGGWLVTDWKDGSWVAAEYPATVSGKKGKR